jgi:hypothetical protein
MNLTNFVDGDVAKGERISGILQLQKKLMLNHPFVIRGASGAVDFELSGVELQNVSRQ